MMSEQTQAQSHQTTLDAIESQTIQDHMMYDMARNNLIDKTISVTIQPIKNGPKYKVQATVTDVDDLRILAAVPLTD